MALHDARVPVQLVEVALRNKPPALLAASPKGTVPVLVLRGGTVIDQSLDIMVWALGQNDPHEWLGPNTLVDAKRWIALNDDGFKPLLDCYKYATRHPERTAAEHRSRAVASLIEPMQAQLQQTRWLCGPNISIADIALFPFVRQFAGVDPAWFATQPWPAMQAWLAHWQDSPLFEAVMRKAWPDPATPKLTN
jgi:glutathione S-transferase